MNPAPVQTQAPPANAAQTRGQAPAHTRNGKAGLVWYQAPPEAARTRPTVRDLRHWTRLWITPWAHPASNINRHRRA
jgi:hypothetical protein